MTRKELADRIATIEPRDMQKARRLIAEGNGLKCADDYDPLFRAVLTLVEHCDPSRDG